MSSSREPRILRIELPLDLPVINVNDRPRMIYKEHRAGSQRYSEDVFKVRTLKEEACKAAKAQSFIPFEKVRIRCIFRAPDNRRRDVANLYPSFKAIIDGLVQAGVIEDDNDSIVRELSAVRGENLPKHSQFIVQVIEDL